jgi:CRISPR/Cas system CSM-associated protein Csm4 (group 5 of RAMP superfamily)
LFSFNALLDHHCSQVAVKLESDQSEDEEEKEEQEEEEELMMTLTDSVPEEDAPKKMGRKKTEIKKRRAKIWRHFADAKTTGESAPLRCFIH